MAGRDVYKRQELGTPIITRGPDDEPDVSLPVYLQIQAQGDQDYKTEYTLLDQKGNSLAAAFGLSLIHIS